MLSRRNTDLFFDEERPMLNVMLVVRQEHGEAKKRVAIGTTDEEEWIKLEKSWSFVEVG